jgi:hypothetical protein
VEDDPMRFSIRDLLWATLVVAMGLGWWMDNRTKHAAVKQAHRLYVTLKFAKEYCDPSEASPAASAIDGGIVFFNSPPDWTPLEEPLVEP